MLHILYLDAQSGWIFQYVSYLKFEYITRNQLLKMIILIPGIRRRPPVPARKRGDERERIGQRFFTRKSN
jgi:hypothetical protein